MPRERVDGNAGLFSATLDRVLRRMTLRHVLRATAVGAGAAGLANFILAASAGARWRTAAAAIAFGVSAVAALRWSRGERTPRSAAAAVERADPSLRNLVVTAAQLLEPVQGVRAYMRERVLREAAARTSTLDVQRAVPLSRDAGLLAAAVASALVLSLVHLPAPPETRSGPLSASDGAKLGGTASDLIVELMPPPYAGRPPSRLVNPATLDVLGGTDAIVRAPGGAAARVRLNGADLVLRDGAARMTFVESGYLAVDVGAVSRLLPLTVTPDAAPAVRIGAPAKDLRFPSNAATIPIAASADDDLGLASFELRYTAVSGGGEQFTFTEGAVPAAVRRNTDRSWTLDAKLALAGLKLEPGDALIYRAVAADRRPGGAGVASSDTFFIEIAGPGDVPLEGVEMPPERERYAMSQAMIVLKLERLQARQTSLAPTELADETGNIAAEQRGVRANFVFLLGGEVEDEEEEAEHSHEISEGRFANQARKEIVAATVLMSHVEKALAAVSIREALPPARAAVKALQRAFGNSRYLLRALPSRVRLDPARRLSGDTSTAVNWDRALTPPSPDPVTETARAALAQLVGSGLSLSEPGSGADPGFGLPANFAQNLRDLSERLLTVPGRAPDLQRAAKDIDAAREAIAAGRVDVAREALRRAAGPLVKRAQQGRTEVPTVSPDAVRLAGAAAIGRGGQR